jgi:PAS domain S-box-containing protein
MPLSLGLGERRCSGDLSILAKGQSSLGMEIARRRGTRLLTGVAQFLLGIAGLALITFVCFQVGFGVSRTAFAYVILIALVSLLGSLSLSVILSILAVACLNYFFTSPLFEFRIDDPEDIERIAVFFVTALVVTALTTKLRASERRFRSFVDYASDAFLLLDEDWTILDVNRQACEGLGYSREELIGKHKSDLDAELDQESMQRLKRRIVGGEAITFETRHRRKDGTSFPVEVRVSQFEQAGYRFLCLVRDITERKRAEDELRASEERFRSVVDHATDGFFLFDEHQVLIDVNRQACESLGYRREEMIGMHPSDFDAGLDKALIGRIGERVTNGETVTFETLHRRKDGTAFPVEIRARQFQRGAHRVRLSLARDITERKQAEEKLRASEERFRTLVQFSFDVYWESDAQHRFIRQEFAEGLAEAPAPGSEIGKTRWEVPYLEPDAEAWRKHRETLDAHLPFRDFELARPASDGGKRYVSVSGLPLFDKTGRFIGYRGVGRHITDRKRIEEALRRSESYLAEAQRLSHTGTIVFSAVGPVYWSEESYRIWGLDPARGLPDLDTVLQRIHPEDRDNIRKEAFEALEQKRKYAIEFRIVLPDGTIKHLESVGYPLISGAGEEMIGTHIDVTERKHAEEEHERLRQLEADLAHVNRLGIMGELAASLAHEILHPIATARNNARAGMRFLELSPPNLGEVREALACVVRDADRAKDIVGRMREHIKNAPPRMDPFGLNEAIQEVIEMVQTAIDKNRIAVRTRLMEGLEYVRGDRVQLQQVLFNLILNSVEAMSSVDGARELLISTQQDHTGEVLVAVQDSGPGIDPEHLERVFSPFYTTKIAGIGMGLSICRSIIAAHGGRLWAEGNRSRGAIFQFTLPVDQEDL